MNHSHITTRPIRFAAATSIIALLAGASGDEPSTSLDTTAIAASVPADSPQLVPPEDLLDPAHWGSPGNVTMTPDAIEYRISRVTVATTMPRSADTAERILAQDDVAP